MILKLVQRNVFSQPKVTQESIVLTSFSLCCDGESYQGSTDSYESILAIAKLCSKIFKIFQLRAQSIDRKQVTMKNLLENFRTKQN